VPLPPDLSSQLGSSPRAVVTCYQKENLASKILSTRCVVVGAPPRAPGCCLWLRRSVVVHRASSCCLLPARRRPPGLAYHNSRPPNKKATGPRGGSEELAGKRKNSRCGVCCRPVVGRACVCCCLRPRIARFSVLFRVACTELAEFILQDTEDQDCPAKAISPSSKDRTIISRLSDQELSSPSPRCPDRRILSPKAAALSAFLRPLGTFDRAARASPPYRISGFSGLGQHGTRANGRICPGHTLTAAWAPFAASWAA
jgi:hypothetical protein